MEYLEYASASVSSVFIIPSSKQRNDLYLYTYSECEQNLILN